MEILYDEMLFEVLRHLDLGQLLKVSSLSKQYNGYILDKNFWNIYFKYKSQTEYRGLVYKVGKCGSIELFKILSTPFNNKIVEKCMYERIYYNALVYNNEPIIRYIEHRIKHESRGGEFGIERLIKRAKRNFSQENANEIYGYMKKDEPILNLWQLKRILSNCHNYEILFRYLNVFGIEVRTFIDMEFIEDVVTGEYKHGYDLFMGIIEAGVISINDLKNETFIYECTDHRIFDYFIYEGLITFDYESIKNYTNGESRWPLCEYYIIKLYEEVINLYKNKRCEDEYRFLCKLMVTSFLVIEDQDIVLTMIKRLCDLKYFGAKLLELILITIELGYDYLTINLKSMKLNYDLS